MSKLSWSIIIVAGVLVVLAGVQSIWFTRYQLTGWQTLWRTTITIGFCTPLTVISALQLAMGRQQAVVIAGAVSIFLVVWLSVGLFIQRVYKRNRAHSVPCRQILYGTSPSFERGE